MTREEIIEKAFESYPDYCNCIQDYDLIREANHQQDIKREAYIKCWEDNFANHPQLPANLDAAAESYSENRTGGIILDDEVKAFKAGAEWQKKQPITFNCIGKQVTMTVQQLIDYYIDSECADVADECGF